MLEQLAMTGFSFEFQYIFNLTIMYYVYVLICNFNRCFYASEFLPAK